MQKQHVPLSYTPSAVGPISEHVVAFRQQEQRRKFYQAVLAKVRVHAQRGFQREGWQTAGRSSLGKVLGPLERRRYLYNDMRAQLELHTLIALQMSVCT